MKTIYIISIRENQTLIYSSVVDMIIIPNIEFSIHFNPLDLTMPEWRAHSIKNLKEALEYLKTYRWSSHLDYLGVKNFPSLTQRDDLLEFFNGEKGYRKSLPDMLKGFSAENGEDVTLE